MEITTLTPRYASPVQTVNGAFAMFERFGVATPIDGDGNAQLHANPEIIALMEGVEDGPKTAKDVAMGKVLHAEAVADAYRDEMASRLAAYLEDDDADAGPLNDAMAQLAAARRTLTQARLTYRNVTRRFKRIPA